MDDNELIEDKIETLNNVINKVDEFEKIFDKLLNSNLNFNDLNKQISPNERIELNLDLSYSIYTLYYSNIY